MIYIVIILLVVLGVFIQGKARNIKANKEFLQALRDNLGQAPNKKYTVENTQHIPGYFVRHKTEDALDDITWNDLSMEDIFRRINYTHSASGEEYLYYLLRSPQKNLAELEHFEELIDWFGNHTEEMVQAEGLFREMGTTGKYSLYDYIDHLDVLGERKNFKHYLVDVLMIGCLCLLPISIPIAVWGSMLWAIVQIYTYFKDKSEIEPYLINFAYVIRVINAAEKLGKIDLGACEKECKQINEKVAILHKIRRGSFFVFAASNSRTSGNPLELILDYFRMVFHLDLIIFNNMLKQLRDHTEELDQLLTVLGQIEAGISVARLRASLDKGYCVPEFVSGDKQYCLEDGYHILLQNPVKNSIQTTRGVLLTGSNASGKSTFLKMSALNAVLAQTIHTCTASKYVAPFWSIYSSMSLRDDLTSGDSYYMVEIKALKRILDATKGNDNERILCFVDEVLSGTNTVERIAASAQILKSLAAPNVMLFAATHDIELTDMLQKELDNYHFEEEVKDGDISFAYRLLNGKATSKNAIRLLEVMGYSSEITERAFETAKRFVDTGLWQA